MPATTVPRQRQPIEKTNERVRKRLTDEQVAQLKEFSALLLRRLRVDGWSPADLGHESGLRAETIRSYLEARNRPSKAALRRLITVLGPEIAKPFADTELAGARPAGFVILPTAGGWIAELSRTRLSHQGGLALIELMRAEGILPQQVHEPAGEYGIANK